MTTPKCPLCGSELSVVDRGKSYERAFCQAKSFTECNLAGWGMKLEAFRRLTPPTDEQILKIAHRYMHLFEMDRINLDFSDDQMINCYKGIGWPNEHGGVSGGS